MAGIIGYGAYIPWTRLGSSTVDWRGRHERAVANFDEDAVTMAVAALGDCLAARDRASVDALYLASTSLPYAEKQSASLVATAADLRNDAFTADIGHSIRSGTLALRMALDGVRAGSWRQAAVVASDCRPGSPGSDLERDGGDAAAALLIGEGDEIARVTAFHSVVNDILDVWRPDGERFLRTAEEHFRFHDGYLHAVTECVKQLLAKTGKSIGEFDRVILYAPDSRRHAEAVARTGADRGRTGFPLLDKVGSTGSSFALLQLVAALEEASPGQQILLVNYGDGADAMIVETTAALTAFQRSSHRGVARQLESAAFVPRYYDFLGWRGLAPLGSNGNHRVAPAPHALYREQVETLRFRGMRCLSCGMVQYPSQRVCAKCQAKDTSESIRLSDAAARLFTYSFDYVARTVDVPLCHGVVDFEPGGRAMMMLTDRNLADVRIGMPLELTFRKFYEADGIHTYLWKAAPVRG